MRKPPENLRSLIISSIKAAEYRRARLYLLISSITLSGSTVGFIFAIKYLVQSLYASEFVSFVALIFSDTDVVLGFWKDITFSLAESLPILVIIGVLISTLMALVSIRTITTNFKVALSPRLSI